MTIDKCTVGLRNALLGSLSSYDEAVLLPQASKSSESDAFKNVAFRLRGDTSRNPAVFGSRFYDGLSAVRLNETDAGIVSRILECSGRREAVLQTLATKIKSEIADSDLVVGPSLECDGDERDTNEWVCGLDATSSFAGLFSAFHSRPPSGTSDSALSRPHLEYFLVVRAGAGVASQTFHARLSTALAAGATLDACLEDDVSPPGSTALRRLQRAGTRNRCRILAEIADELKLTGVATVGDSECPKRTRTAVSHVDLQVNTLNKIDETISTTNSVTSSNWRYITAVDCASSTGAGTLSNAAQGVVLFAPPVTTETLKTTPVRNECLNALPFTTPRLQTERKMVDVVCKHKQLHPDADWVTSRFAWQSSIDDKRAANIPPTSLWGSHGATTWSKSFARELSVNELEPLVLSPELVVTAGIAAGKLRAIVRSQ